jgi:hypothetical protein
MGCHPIRRAPFDEKVFPVGRRLDGLVESGRPHGGPLPGREVEPNDLRGAVVREEVFVSRAPQQILIRRDLSRLAGLPIFSPDGAVFAFTRDIDDRTERMSMTALGGSL